MNDAFCGEEMMYVWNDEGDVERNRVFQKCTIFLLECAEI